MADRLYFGTDATQQWLEAQRARLLAERASGKRTTMILAAGVKTEKQVEVSVAVALFQVEHDLCFRFPQLYDRSVLMPIKRTRAKYLFS